MYILTSGPNCRVISSIYILKLYNIQYTVYIDVSRISVVSGVNKGPYGVPSPSLPGDYGVAPGFSQLPQKRGLGGGPIL